MQVDDVEVRGDSGERGSGVWSPDLVGIRNSSSMASDKRGK